MVERTVAQALAGGLRRHGVTDVFGQSLPSALFLATPDHGIRQVAYRTENAGGAMADGFARISGRIGVVAAQNGPAATLLIPPLAEALKASVPVLALVQEVPRSNRDRNAFQEFDHAALFASCAKWLCTVDDPERVDDVLDAAVIAACSGRPGPAVLMLPRDVLNAPAPAVANRRSNLRVVPAGSHGPHGHRRGGSGCAPGGSRVSPARCRRRGSPLGRGYGTGSAAGAGVSASGHHHDGQGSGRRVPPAVAGSGFDYMGRTSASHHVRDIVAEADVVVFVGSRTMRTAPTPGAPSPRAPPTCTSTSTAPRSDATTNLRCGGR